LLQPALRVAFRRASPAAAGSTVCPGRCGRGLLSRRQAALEQIGFAVAAYPQPRNLGPQALHRADLTGNTRAVPVRYVLVDRAHFDVSITRLGKRRAAIEYEGDEGSQTIMAELPRMRQRSLDDPDPMRDDPVAEDLQRLLPRHANARQSFGEGR